MVGGQKGGLGGGTGAGGASGTAQRATPRNGEGEVVPRRGEELREEPSPGAPPEPAGKGKDRKGQRGAGEGRGTKPKYTVARKTAGGERREATRLKAGRRKVPEGDKEVRTRDKGRRKSKKGHWGA